MCVIIRDFAATSLEGGGVELLDGGAIFEMQIELERGARICEWLCR